MLCLLQMALPDPVDMLADYPSSPFGEPDLNAFGPRRDKPDTILERTILNFDALNRKDAATVDKIWTQTTDQIRTLLNTETYNCGSPRCSRCP